MPTLIELRRQVIAPRHSVKAWWERKWMRNSVPAEQANHADTVRRDLEYASNHVRAGGLCRIVIKPGYIYFVWSEE